MNYGQAHNDGHMILLDPHTHNLCRPQELRAGVPYRGATPRFYPARPRRDRRRGPHAGLGGRGAVRPQPLPAGALNHRPLCRV